MLRNFFTVALRNLLKHKIFSFINIFGLVLGIAASLLIVQYARFELSYDRFEPGAGQIYRLQLDRYNNGKLSTRWAGNPFEYFFLDQHFAEQYKADRQFGRTFGLFAGLAIFVSCLGLLGVAAFVTAQRTKEIGIRKIVGASLSRILLLLTRDFMKPLVIAFVLAIPLTWWLLHQWLENFAFRSANPANSLRTE